MHRISGLLCLMIVLILIGCNSPRPAIETQSTPAEETQPADPTAAPIEPSATVPAQPTATPEPTATHIPVTPTPFLTATPRPTPVITGLDGTLILYTTVIAIPTTDPAAPWEPHHAFRAWPALPFVDPGIFDALYGKREGMEDFSMFFDEFRAKPSPDGRYVLVPGLSDYPEYGFLGGTGTWLLDLQAGEARQLLPDGVVATWSPSSDAITYVADDTLYTLSVAQGAEPQPLFQGEGLWWAYWSPDGRSIATLISTHPEPTEPYDPKYAVTLLLVPVNGDPVRQLAVQEVFGMEYSSSQMAWSPDGQYLLVLNKVYDLEGNLLSPDYSGGASWLPNDARLLINGGEGLRIVTIAGDEVAHISDTFAGEWAFSHDGRRLAYTQGERNAQVTAVYDLERDESQIVYSGSGWPLRWSADDGQLLMGVHRDDRSQIIAVRAEPGGAEQVVVESAELIEVVPYPVP